MLAADRLGLDRSDLVKVLDRLSPGEQETLHRLLLKAFGSPSA